MAAKKFKSSRFPEDEYVAFEVGDFMGGTVYITAATRYKTRNFERTSVMLDKESAVDFVQKLAAELGLSVLSQSDESTA